MSKNLSTWFMNDPYALIMNIIHQMNAISVDIFEQNCIFFNKERVRKCNMSFL